MPEHHRLQPERDVKGYDYNSLEGRVYDLELRNEQQDNKRSGFISSVWFPILVVIAAQVLPYLLSFMAAAFGGAKLR